MARRKRKDYDDVHTYIERVEDVLLSESSWSTSDSDCSGCMHLSKGSTIDESEEDKNDKLELSTLSSLDSSLRKGKKLLKYKFTNNLCRSKLISENNSSLSSSISASGVRFSSATAPPLNSVGGMLQQLSLLTAGAQPWNYNISAVYNKKFAYAATLVIYVYQVEGEGNEWQLCSILAEHRKTITCIHWHPSDEDVLASSSMDQCVYVWSVSRQCVLQAINICKVPTLISWCYGIRDVLSFTTQSGPIQVWHYANNTEPISFRDQQSFSSGIVTFAWHPSISRRLIVGHEDGKLTLFREDTKKIRYSNMIDGLDDGESHPTRIRTLAWDNHSPDYVLVSYHERQLWLIDVNSFSIVTKFVLPGSSSVATLAWLPNAPGMFVTGDCEKGILRIWSVSKSSPLENCLLKDTGFHCLSVTLINETTNEISNVDSHNERGPTIPRVSVLSLFKDGGIGIYHIKRKEWIFKREHGHTETIFDCSFKPEDSDLLATGSFDGSIKIWRVDTMEAVETLPNRGTIIYSISWAPADLNCIAAGTSSGDVFLWNITKQKIIQEFKMHKNKKVFCVAWNMFDSRKIASVGESGYCYVHQVSGVNGALLQGYKHPGPVYGCHWRDEEIIATGCEDGKIRVFNVTKSTKDPILELKAHQQKVFGVKWNPVYKDILCSGSNDTCIKIWSFSKAQCLSVLVGHSDNVRGLVWCPEIPSLLISGSWDRTLRVWDAKSCSCLDIVFDHRADVYGLSIHPLRPFLLASCSRDSTVRLWSLSSIVTSLQLKVLADRPIEEVIGKKDPNGTLDSNMRLCGLRSDHLLNTVSKVDPANKQLRSLKLFADLFCADVHVRNLWDLVYVLQGHKDISSLSPQYPSSIVHHSHLFKCAMASANEKEIMLSKTKGIIKNSQSEGQESLANLYLSYGALQQYCELMIKNNKWDHALSLAPSVSIDYWKSILERRTNELLADDNEACVPYLLASKDADKLIEFHITRGHLDKALSSCMALTRPRQTLRKGSMPLPPAVPPRTQKLDLISHDLSMNDHLIDCAQKVADWHINRGSPILAACSLLAVDQIHGAVKSLLRGHELELAFVIGQMLKMKKSLLESQRSALENLISSAKRYLVYRAIKIKDPDLALEIAKSLPQDEDRSLLIAEVVIAFSGSTKTDFSNLNLHPVVPPPEEFQSTSYASKYQEVLSGLLSSPMETGLVIGIAFLKDSVIKKELNCTVLWRTLRLLQAVPLSNDGNLNLKSEQKAMLLSLSAFLGAVKATALRYNTVVIPLLDHAKLLIEKYNPSELEFLRKLIYEIKSKYEIGDTTLGFDLSNVSPLWLDSGITKMSGSHLPRHSDNHVCCITHEVIKGPGFFLENDASVIGLNNAFMWAKVHPFSPLGTGHRLNPF